MHSFWDLNINFPCNRDELTAVKTKILGKCVQTETLQKQIEEKVSILTKLLVETGLYKDAYSKHVHYDFFMLRVNSMSNFRWKSQKKKNRSKLWKQRWVKNVKLQILLLLIIFWN